MFDICFNDFRFRHPFPGAFELCFLMLFCLQYVPNKYILKCYVSERQSWYIFFAEADSTLRDVKAQKANQIRVH